MNSLIPPIGTADNLFHDGNPATGELGTIVSAEWLNNIQGAMRGNQSELIALLTAAGIEPNAAKADQVLTALRGLFLGKSSQASDAATLGGRLPNHYLDLASSTGNLDLTGSRKMISTLSSRARVVTDLVQYRGWASETGAIAFVAPPGDSVMAALEIASFEYGGGSNPKSMHLDVQFYRPAPPAGFQRNSMRSSGAYTPTVRLGVKNGTNQTALIIGNIDEAWGYQHIAVTKALLSHTGLTDVMCTGWTSELVTSLDNFENVVELKDARGSGSYPGRLAVTFRDTPEPGTLACNGAAVSRTAYAALFAAIGTKYGAGDGSTTFNLPNIPDGHALLAASGSAVGSLSEGEIKGHTHVASGTTGEGGSHVHSLSQLRTYTDRPGAQGFWDRSVNGGGAGFVTDAAGAHTHDINLNIGMTGASHNLAAGMKLLVCITYE